MYKANLAQKAVAAGLSLMAMASIMPMPAMAAVNYGTGSIVINKNAENGSVTYSGFQIFKANVSDDASSSNSTGKTETNIAWASDDVKTAVEKVIKAKDSSYAGKTAEDAADFIKSKITDTTNTTRVDSASFANKLADAVDGLTDKTSVTPGTAATLTEGYWLFVTDNASLSGSSVGTAPIFAVVGGNTQVTVSEKTTVPTVSKKVQNNGATDYSSTADAQVGTNLSYQLTGTVADNIGTYSTYSYTFDDTLSAGLTADKSSVAVTIDGKTVASTSYATTYDETSNKLTVSFTDLKTAKDASGSVIPVTGSSKVVVTYNAKLDPAKAVVYGGTGNDNSATLTYSNDPHNTGTGKSTTTTTTKTFTYQLVLHKVDRTTEVNLSGAKFTLANSAGKYVQSNGTLGDTAYEFTTGDDGTINVKGLDADTYTVHEATAPTGYDTVADFTFQIKPTYDADAQTLTSLENVLTANDSVIAGDTDGVTTDNVLTAGNKNQADASTGTVKVTVGDVKRSTMPLTGMDGVTFTWIAGGAVLVIGMANILRSKKKMNE